MIKKFWKFTLLSHKFEVKQWSCYSVFTYFLQIIKLKEDSESIEKCHMEELQKISSDFEDKSTSEAQLNLEVNFFFSSNAITENLIKPDTNNCFLFCFFCRCRNWSKQPWRHWRVKMTQKSNASRRYQTWLLWWRDTRSLLFLISGLWNDTIFSAFEHFLFT